MSRFTRESHPEYTDAQLEELNRRFEMETEHYGGAWKADSPGDKAVSDRIAARVLADYDDELAVARYETPAIVIRPEDLGAGASPDANALLDRLETLLAECAEIRAALAVIIARSERQAVTDADQGLPR